MDQEDLARSEISPKVRYQVRIQKTTTFRNLLGSLIRQTINQELFFNFPQIGTPK